MFDLLSADGAGASPAEAGRLLRPTAVPPSPLAQSRSVSQLPTDSAIPSRLVMVGNFLHWRDVVPAPNGVICARRSGIARTPPCGKVRAPALSMFCIAITGHLHVWSQAEGRAGSRTPTTMLASLW